MTRESDIHSRAEEVWAFKVRTHWYQLYWQPNILYFFLKEIALSGSFRYFKCCLENTQLNINDLFHLTVQRVKEVFVLTRMYLGQIITQVILTAYNWWLGGNTGGRNQERNSWTQTKANKSVWWGEGVGIFPSQAPPIQNGKQNAAYSLMAGSDSLLFYTSLEPSELQSLTTH